MTVRNNAEAEALNMIVVMGVTGAGKSYFINQLAGEEVVKEGPDLESCQ
jgi:putative ribosome biogenesis GTPase RsgA